MGDGGWREGRLWGMVGGGRGACGGWWVEGGVSVGDGGWRVGCLWGMVGGGWGVCGGWWVEGRVSVGDGGWRESEQRFT